MNNVYVRLFIYFIAPLLALLPGVTFDNEAFTLLIDLEAAAIGLTAALVGVAGVFRRWGVK